MVRFRLARAGLVELEVIQVAPQCRTIGSFRVRGHAGVNSFRLPRRVEGRRLTPGTYRIRAQVVGRPGARPLDARFVVLKKRPRGPVAPLLRRDECADTMLLAAVATGGFVPGGAAGPTAAPKQAGSAPPKGLGVRGAIAEAGQVLGAVAPPEPPPAIRPFIYGGLALAILLLALAALPYTVVPSGRAASLLVYRRHDLAAAGLAVLAGVFVLYLLSVA